MGSSAKVISLAVRPSQVSQLCFEVGGILGESNVELGTTAPLFDFPAFYGILGSMPAVPGHPARLLYDFLQIQAAVKPFTLVALRAEANKAALSKAINARANAFYAKYANATDVIARMRQLYSPTVAQSKPYRLDVLSSISENQMIQLRDAYISDGRTDVVRTTQSRLDSQLDSTGKSISKSGSFLVAAEVFPPPAPDTALTINGGDEGVQEDFQESSSTGSAAEHQIVANTDYGYRVPFAENAAQYERAQISLIDEKFNQFMAGQNLPFLEAVFFNELTMIDSDVYRTQIAYLNTILMSPIQGTVTGIYKNPGDAITPGEPVLRVENTDVIFLVATVVFRGPIPIGAGLSVTTTLFDSAGPPTTIAGVIVAARGHQEDDRWEIIAKCNNLDAGKPIFPLGYHFDYDDTTVVIS
jgi:biotin carboxyl carrier protein